MTRRLKVLALSYLFPNSEKPDHGIFVLNRLKALSQHVDIKVINPIPWFPWQGLIDDRAHYSRVPEQEVIAGIDVYHPRFLSVPGYFKGSESARYYRAIAPLVQLLTKEHDYDILDMHWTFPDLPAGLRIAQQYGLKSMVTLRGMEAFHRQDKDRRQAIVEQGLREVDGIVSLSQEMKTEADAITGNPDKSIVIRNGVDTDKFYFIPQDECRQRLSIDAQERIVLSVGSLIYRKGYDLVFNALARIKQEQGNAPNFYIVGSQGAEGDYRAELNSLIERLDVKDNVRFVGQVKNSELIYWYNACDVYCLSSRGEGSPNVLIEALACGCPSITTDVGSAREIIEAEPGLGICVTPDSHDLLKYGIERLLAEYLDRRNNALSVSKYSWSWCAQRVMYEYQRITSGN